MPIIIGKQNLTELGKLILWHRKKGNFSRSELADMAGVGQTIIYEIEKGKTTVRSDILFKLLYALNIRVSLQSPFTDEYEKEQE
jgi:transcriptional regulator with XRE-family HTH domain